MGISLSKSTVVSLEELKSVPMPPATQTYQPVSHYELAMNIHTIANDMLTPKGYVFMQAKQGLARDGQRVFGVMSYKNGHDEMGFAIGWRNSYDKSMAAALAFGASVFVCDNLCISGDITIMRKHTKNIEDDLKNSIVSALYGCTNNYQHFLADVDRLKSASVLDQDGYRMLGLLIGEGVLTATIFNEAMRQWKSPNYKCFSDRNAWSLYNAITEGLKSAPPHRALEVHRQLHDVFVAEYLPPAAGF